MRRAAWVVLVLAELLACGDGSAGNSKPTGSVGGPCYGNGTCDTGLSCASDLCVRLSGGAGSGGGSSGAAGTMSGTGTAGTTGTGGASGTAGTTSSTGTAGTTGTSGTGGGVKANGEICAAPSECTSGICQKNKVGESRCYGTATANAVCSDVYDCVQGLCVPKTLAGVQGVCVPGIGVCVDKMVSDECTAYVLAFCQLIQSCGATVSASIPQRYRTDFDFCVGSECTTARDGVSDLTPAQCLSGVNGIDNGTFGCP